MNAYEIEKQGEGEHIELNALGRLFAKLFHFGENASLNLHNSVTALTVQGWIRIIVIIGGYLLLRPYLLNVVTKGGVQKLEDQNKKDKAKISPNELRGVHEKIEEQEQADEAAGAAESSGADADWGQAARVRQREVMKKLLAAEEQKRWEEEDDADIADLLT